MKKHVYEPLSSNEHIRIIILHPSEDPSSALTCSIKQVKLDDNFEDYECISYAWGEPVFSRCLGCNDCSSFEITPSLHSALKHFRSKRRPRHLWADAVCINQSDLGEKSLQIPLMARIFHAASRVLIWLGNGDNEGNNTIEWLSRLTRTSSIIHEHAGQSDLLKAKLHGLFADDWQRVVRLIELPWFSRRWVVQEVALNTDVSLYCGSSKISWPRFILAMQIWSKWRDSLEVSEAPVNALFKLSGPPLKAILKLGYLWRAWCLLDDDPQGCGLLDLLDDFSHFECAEANDKIYALIGLATDVRTTLGRSTAPKMTITIDYSMPIQAVFRMVAEQRMRSGRVFSTLADASARRSVCSTGSSRGLPSWVPDLEVKRRHGLIINDSPHLCSPDVAFTESGMCLNLSGAVRDLDFDFFHTSLQASAIVCSELDTHIPRIDGSRGQFLSWLREGWKMLESEVVSYYKVDDPIRILIKQALCQVVTGHGAFLKCLIDLQKIRELQHTMTSGAPAMDVDVGAQSAVSRYTILLGCTLLDHMELSEENQEYDKFMPFIDLALTTMAGRRLFLGSLSQLVASNSNAVSRTIRLLSGSSRDSKFIVMGIGPEDLEQGDIGVVFEGTEHPLFLRSVGGGCYRLLGDGSFVMLPTASYCGRNGRDFRHYRLIGPEDKVNLALI